MIRQITLSLLALTISSCGGSHEFIPIVRMDYELVEKPELLNDSLRKNMVHVLSYYKEDWHMEGGSIMVLQADRELLWNYTIKAMDADWLDAHPLDQEDR